MNCFALDHQDPAPHNHLHTEVEVLNRHTLDLPERVAGLPKELESRESDIPYDYDFSLQDPQDRVIHNNIVELEVTVLSAVQSPPISFLRRDSLAKKEEGHPEQIPSSQKKPKESDAGFKDKEQRASGVAAYCGGQLDLDPPPILSGQSPLAGGRGDTVSVGQVNIRISPSEVQLHLQQPREQPPPQQQR